MIHPGKKSLSLGSQNKSVEKAKTFKIVVPQRTPKSRHVLIHSSVHALRSGDQLYSLSACKENTKKQPLRCLYVKGGVPSFFEENPKNSLYSQESLQKWFILP